MKKKQFESIGKQLLPQLSGFVSKGWLLYREPVNHVLRGFCCDDSGFDKTQFTVYVFCLPLYVPTDHVYFLFGHRLKDERDCGIWWDVNDPNTKADLLARIQSQGIPFLSGIDSPRHLIRAAECLAITQETYKWEAIAYSAILVDDYEQARLAFRRLANAIDVSIPWQTKMLDRANQLEQSLDRDPQQAKQMLAEWEQFSVSQLGIK